MNQNNNSRTQKANAVLLVPVSTNAEATPEKMRALVQRLIDTGLADAAATLESAEGDQETAQLATDLNIGAPAILWDGVKSADPQSVPGGDNLFAPWADIARSLAQKASTKPMPLAINPNFFHYVVGGDGFLRAAFDRGDEAKDYASRDSRYEVLHRMQLAERFPEQYGDAQRDFHAQSVVRPEDWRAALKMNDEVFWTDPDNGVCSGVRVIKEIVSDSGKVESDETVVRLDHNGSETEAYAGELSAVQPGDVKDHNAVLEDLRGEQAWEAQCNEQGWNEASQVIHLEGFLRDRGLFGAFAAYAQQAAEEENAG